MKYAHGQHAAYVLDKCRCEPCRLSNREYERARAQRIDPAYVGADAARQHVMFLREHSVGLKTIAKASGVPHGSLSKLIYGDPARNMGPSKRVRLATAERILAVMPTDAAGNSQQPAGPTWVLIDQMVAAGVPRAAIGRYLGQTAGSLQLARTTIDRRHVIKVKEMHARWLTGDIVLRARGHRNVSQPVAIRPPVRQPDYQDRSQILVELAEIIEARNEQPRRASAACRNRPPHIWFPGRGDRRCEAKAKQICAACLVRRECLSANLNEPSGVFGGMTASERKQLRTAA